MTESSVHRRMKAIVRGELERQRYSVAEEPLSPPDERMWWRAYRPDLLGYRRGGDGEEVVLVECETHPSMRRFKAKNYSSVWFQPFLFQGGSIRRILAVPQGRLGAVDMRIRDGWEIWVLGTTRPICRIGPSGSGNAGLRAAAPVAAQARP